MIKSSTKDDKERSLGVLKLGLFWARISSQMPVFGQILES